MTVDELIQQLIKIKEIHPESGKWLVIGYSGELEGQLVNGRRDGTFAFNKANKTHKNEIIIT